MAGATSYEENYPNRDELVRSVSAYLRGDTKKFYIGITSGYNKDDGKAAMKRRRTGDEYKNEHGINRMIAIARSTSQQVCRDIEDELVECYRGRGMCVNRSGGGAGRPTGQPWSFVYLGLAD